MYGKNYLSRGNAVEIDPIELRLSDKPYLTPRMNGFFGAIRDAMPDFWGRRVIERNAGKAGLDEFDYLMHGPDDRAGALGFGLNKEPPAPRRKLIAQDSRLLAMECGPLGRVANMKNLLTACKRFLLTKEQARLIIGKMVQSIRAEWDACLRRAGASEADSKLVSSARLYGRFFMITKSDVYITGPGSAVRVCQE